MNAHDSKIRVWARDDGSQFTANVRCRFLCIASHPHQKLPRRLREKVQSAPVQNGSEAGAPCLISPMHSACIPWPALCLPIKNPLSCWNSEEQDRGDVPLPREVRGDNDMDTGDAFALLRYSDR